MPACWFITQSVPTRLKPLQKRGFRPPTLRNFCMLHLCVVPQSHQTSSCAIILGKNLLLPLLQATGSIQCSIPTTPRATFCTKRAHQPCKDPRLRYNPISSSSYLPSRWHTNSESVEALEPWSSWGFQYGPRVYRTILLS